MGIKVFCGEEFSEHKQEWNQFKEVHNLIKEKYANRPELIYVLSNFRVSNRQIDVLILTEKGIAIIDLKSYKGKIIGNENGDWKVIDNNGEEIPLKTNLFGQLKSQKFAFLDKLNFLRKGNFEQVEADKLGNIQCWGYFEKSSSYDIEQIGRNAWIWFDVITGDNLIEKMRFIDARYLLGPIDMDSIVKGLSLKEFSFEKQSIQEDRTFESNWNKELSVFIEPQNWNKFLSKIKNSNLITIVGEPNIGKTTAIMNLANELKKSGYRIHEDKELLINSRGAKDKKDRTEYYRLLNNKNVFILDDLFGTTQYDPKEGNKWVNLIIDILDSAVNQSKIIIGSRQDVKDDFVLNNNELSRRGLLNEFRNSIVELRFSDYDGKNLKGIFDNNLNYIQLNEKNKENILNRNIEKITKELLLPGDISYFIRKAKENVDFQESELDIYIDKAKKQINSIVIDIKLLNDYEKIFLYTIFINQNFSIDDLEVVYLHCLPLGLTNRNYFAECIENLEGKFIKKTIEIQYLADKKHKVEFIHDVYKEAIEKILTTEKVERLRIEEILKKFHDLIRLQSIDEWNTNTSKISIILEESNYDTIKLNIFKIILRYYTIFNIQIQDLVFEILDSLSFDIFPFSLGADKLDREMPDYFDGNRKFLAELFNNYDKFVEERSYFNTLFIKDELKINIAYCFAYRLNSNIIINFQDKLNELSNRNGDINHLIAKCIIKYYDFLKEDNKKLLFSLGLKTTIMKDLIHNYDLISNSLKEILLEHIQSATEDELIETEKVFLVNYSILPEKLIKQYDFIFKSNNELIIKQIGNAFDTWFSGAFTHMNYDKKREKIDNKVLNLYCEWLKNDKNDGNTFYMCSFIGDRTLQGELAGSIYSYKNVKSDLINPKWSDPFYRNLKEAIEIRLISLLSSKNTLTNKGYLYSDAFDWYQCSGNNELLNKISNIINEEDSIKLGFLEECLWKTIDDIEIKEINNYPFKITISQFKLIEVLSKPPNRYEIQIKANEKLNYIKDLIDKKIIKITKDDYS